MKLVPVGAGFAERTVTTSEKFFASLGRVPVLADNASMWSNVFTDENGLSIDEKNGDRLLALFKHCSFLKEPVDAGSSVLAIADLGVRPVLACSMA